MGIFPNQASAIRLVGAILADLHDEWQATDRRYLSEHSMAALNPERDTIATASSHPATDTEANPKTHHSTGRRQRSMGQALRTSTAVCPGPTGLGVVQSTKRLAQASADVAAPVGCAQPCGRIAVRIT